MDALREFDGHFDLKSPPAPTGSNQRGSCLLSRGQAEAAIASPETEPILASHRLPWERRFYTTKVESECGAVAVG